MKSFNSVEELFEDIKNHRSPWHKFVLNHKWSRWLIYNAKDVPFDFYNKCKRGWQRAYWGISQEDVWGLDWYLSKIILKGLKRLKENKYGCPYIDGFTGENDFNEMQKEWDRILDAIIWTFEVSQKIQDDYWLLWPKNGWNEKQYNNYKELEFIYLMTEEETKRYYQGWDLFQRYYFSLWE